MRNHEHSEEEEVTHLTSPGTGTKKNDASMAGDGGNNGHARRWRGVLHLLLSSEGDEMPPKNDGGITNTMATGRSH